MSCFDDIRTRMSLITKKEAYIYLSFVLLGLLIMGIINDAVCMMVTERTENTTQKFSLAVLLVHAVAFYLGLLGFVYVTQTAGDNALLAGRALAAVIGNGVAFVFRVAYEAKYYRYRKEEYHG